MQPRAWQDMCRRRRTITVCSALTVASSAAGDRSSQRPLCDRPSGVGGWIERLILAPVPLEWPRSPCDILGCSHKQKKYFGFCVYISVSQHSRIGDEVTQMHICIHTDIEEMFPYMGPCMEEKPDRFFKSCSAETCVTMIVRQVLTR